VWSVYEKQYVKQWGIARYKVVPIKEFEVVPNGEQVMRYANKSGYGWRKAVGILLIILVGVGLWKFAGLYTNGEAKFLTRTFAIILSIGLSFLTQRPANIAMNNAKAITEKQLIHYQAIDPELNYFWDSVYNKGGIIKN
jgi:hypothetical protein